MDSIARDSRRESQRHAQSAPPLALNVFGPPSRRTRSSFQPFLRFLHRSLAITFSRRSSRASKPHRAPRHFPSARWSVWNRAGWPHASRKNASDKQSARETASPRGRSSPRPAKPNLSAPLLLPSPVPLWLPTPSTSTAGPAWPACAGKASRARCIARAYALVNARA